MRDYIFKLYRKFEQKPKLNGDISGLGNKNISFGYVLSYVSFTVVSRKRDIGRNKWNHLPENMVLPPVKRADANLWRLDGSAISAGCCDVVNHWSHRNIFQISQFSSSPTWISLGIWGVGLGEPKRRGTQPQTPYKMVLNVFLMKNI